MNFDLPSWTNELDQSGWIAIILLVAFVVVALLTIFMIWKVVRQTSVSKPVKEKKETVSVPKKTANKTAPGKLEEEADPVEEAEVFLTYGLRDQAIKVLEKHLAENPSDKRVSAMLDKVMKTS